MWIDRFHARRRQPARSGRPSLSLTRHSHPSYVRQRIQAAKLWFQPSHAPARADRSGGASLPSVCFSGSAVLDALFFEEFEDQISDRCASLNRREPQPLVLKHRHVEGSSHTAHLPRRRPPGRSIRWTHLNGTRTARAFGRGGDLCSTHVQDRRAIRIGSASFPEPFAAKMLPGGSPRPWRHSATSLWRHSATSLWRHSATSLWRHSVTSLWRHSVTSLWRHSATSLWRHSVTSLWRHSATSLDVIAPRVLTS